MIPDILLSDTCERHDVAGHRFSVIPAKAGIQERSSMMKDLAGKGLAVSHGTFSIFLSEYFLQRQGFSWIPAFAGMTDVQDRVL